ncbi:hypothetical protein SLEP1_g18074 [Rubroshorea leprosula]|uniref:Uncharacterized protein n=1 Tax=Rubroshorea leprosula TaxID=152421 RepID=A0AAV5J574_9ROSI|nr:hypothetical protein SLEP1_g18074 [Rubroshorea leprosula]
MGFMLTKSESLNIPTYTKRKAAQQMNAYSLLKRLLATLHFPITCLDFGEKLNSASLAEIVLPSVVQF